MFACHAHFTTFNPNEPITSYIDDFEIKWSCLYSYTPSANPNTYKAAYRVILEIDEYKRDCLLAALVKHHPNIVDNPTTKNDLTYNNLKQRLMGLSNNGQLNGYDGGNNNSYNGGNNCRNNGNTPSSTLVVHLEQLYDVHMKGTEVGGIHT